MAGMELAAIGDNCIDRFLPPVDDCLVGGNALNVAVQWALLGRQPYYFGAVGNDAAGAAVLAALREKGVRLDHLRTSAGERTAYTDIEISDDGERRFVFEEFGACASYRPAPEDMASLRRKRLIHIGWMNGTQDLKRALAGSGAIVSQDLSVNNQPENLDPAHLDVAFCSSLPEEGGTRARQLVAGGARMAVMTMGAAGSMVFDGLSFRVTPAPPITPEDTTGAGDAFIAGFLAALSDSCDLDTCLERGTLLAAAACMHRGGFPQSPLRGPAEP